MSNICQGKTRKNKSCTRRTKLGPFCHYHRNQVVKEPAVKSFNFEECPICLEANQNQHIFSCRHSYCHSCISQLQQYLCPLCRKDLTDEIPQNLKRVQPQPFTQQQFLEIQRQLPPLENLVQQYGHYEAFELYVALLVSLGLPNDQIPNLSVRVV